MRAWGDYCQTVHAPHSIFGGAMASYHLGMCCLCAGRSGSGGAENNACAAGRGWLYNVHRGGADVGKPLLVGSMLLMFF